MLFYAILIMVCKKDVKHFFCLQACHFDPLLDDSIMFAKKLSKLGKNVDLSIVDHLPHGFLSLSDTSVEAKKAASLCLEKIMKVLNDGAT